MSGSIAASKRRGTPRRRPRMAREERVRLVLDTAEALFYARGVHEVGMDELIAAAGLGKATVYRLFPTKEALIAAYLRRASERVLARVDETIAAHRGQPRQAILAIFDAVIADASRADFRGCAFNNASIEFTDPEHPARRVAREHREQLRRRLRRLARSIRPAGAARLGDQLALIVDGIYTSAAHLGPDGPARSARPLLEKLLSEPPAD